MQEILQENLRVLIENIEAERLKYSAHHIIKLIAVSKYAPLEQIIALYNAGQRAFGENKVQDLKAKMQGADNLPLEWHFIGTLQENKINALLALKPTLFQALDSLKLAESLQKRLEANNQTLNCLLEVRSADESSKSGFGLESAVDSYLKVQDSCKNIRLKGIMTIATNSNDIKVQDICFKKTKEIFDSLSKNGAEILSMGMSSDYRVAIANGANMVRIGSDIFKNA